MYLAERLARETGRDYALRMLKDNIIRLELEPGSRVSENELAAELGLSRTPVREALIELSKVKIVQVYPQRGSAIAPIDYGLFEEAHFMRQTLECAVARRCCEQELADALHQHLRENVALQEFYMKNRSPQKLLELDNAFHQLLFVAAGMPQVYILMNSFTIHFDRVRSMAYHAVKDIKTVGDHQAILAAIEARDAERAAAVMDKHLNRHQVEKEELRARFPQYFKA